MQFAAILRSFKAARVQDFRSFKATKVEDFFQNCLSQNKPNNNFSLILSFPFSSLSITFFSYFIFIIIFQFYFSLVASLNLAPSSGSELYGLAPLDHPAPHSPYYPGGSGGAGDSYSSPGTTYQGTGAPPSSLSPVFSKSLHSPRQRNKARSNAGNNDAVTNIDCTY